MSRLSPAVAQIRNAVRAALGETIRSDALVLVACSGGADSMALASAAAFAAPRVGLVTVDHGLQEGSAQRAQAVAKWAGEIGIGPAEVATVSVGSVGGPEAAARQARYEALAEAARRHGASCVLLGHTEDDQAETVLLALARGSGPRGVAGMPSRFTRHDAVFVRPLLEISRATCRAACQAEGLAVWDDPHNGDPAFARARLRATAMPALVAALGADVVPNLARTAALIAADSAYLDEKAKQALAECRTGDGLAVAVLESLDDPIRTRVLHAWAVELGVPGGALSHRHVAALDRLVMRWRGQGASQLPGGISVRREGKRLSHTRS